MYDNKHRDTPHVLYVHTLSVSLQTNAIWSSFNPEVVTMETNKQTNKQTQLMRTSYSNMYVHTISQTVHESAPNQWVKTTIQLNWLCCVIS